MPFQCRGTPLFLACDVMPGNSNMSRISNKYGRLGMAAKFILKGEFIEQGTQSNFWLEKNKCLYLYIKTIYVSLKVVFERVKT